MDGRHDTQHNDIQPNDTQDEDAHDDYYCDAQDKVHLAGLIDDT